MTAPRTAARAVLVFVAGLVGAALGYLLFVVVPEGSLARLLGVVLAVGTTLLGVRFGGRIAAHRVPVFDVAEVAVEGPITRAGGQPAPTGPVGIPADDVVDAIERADRAAGADALLLTLNTPGGEVVPSEDIRQAAADFDGPTVAYATDTCASGGYLVASACDEVWAREASIVGSIGVLLPQVRAADLAEKLGVSYEGFAAGEYKDAGMPLKELEDEEREYFRGLTDEFYDQFVDTVAEGRDMDPETVRDTEARVYLGRNARERGLVDELGDREDVEAALADRLGVERVVVEDFTPELGLTDRLRAGAQGMAYAAAAGVADAVGADEGSRFRFR